MNGRFEFMNGIEAKKTANPPKADDGYKKVYLYFTLFFDKSACGSAVRIVYLKEIHSFW